MRERRERERDPRRWGRSAGWLADRGDGRTADLPRGRHRDRAVLRRGATSTLDATLSTDAAKSDATPGDAATTDAAALAQAIAIPMYMDPSAADWAEETAAASTVSLLVANPNSGPGASADAAYTQAIATAHTAGQTIVGYVHTSYGARAIADVEADIDAWYSFYPAIDGIFSDETATARHERRALLRPALCLCEK